MKTDLKKIDWGNVITYNPNFGFDFFGDLPQGGIKVPAYGFYGGPQNTRPIPPGEEPKGVDVLDTLFGRHDLALSGLLKDKIITQEEVPAFISAHVALITGITDLGRNTSSGLLQVDIDKDTGQATQAGSAEATLYAGLTILALTADLASIPGRHGLNALEAALDFSDLSEPVVYDDVREVVTQAAEDMETGFAKLPGAGKSLHGAIHHFEEQLVHLLTPLDTPDYG
jgi:hypothetical protein